MLVSYLQQMGWFSPLVVLLSVVISIIILQLIKFSFGVHKFRLLFRNGGIPSTHSTIIGSSLAGIFLVQGVSMLFVLACAVGLIVLRDSFGVRYAVGQNAKVLYDGVGPTLKRRVFLDEGHTRLQILVGFLLGVVVSLLTVVSFGVSML